MAKILIVDDSDTSLQFAKEALEKDGHSIKTSKNIWIATLVAEFQPDLVLMDVSIDNMMSGPVAVSELKKNPSNTAKIYLYSGLAEAELKKYTEECGADGYIMKGDDAATFKMKIANLL